MNKNERLKAMDAMSNSGANHFLALYKEKAYRGLYEVHTVEELMRISKIHGTGPKGSSTLFSSFSQLVFRSERNDDRRASKIQQRFEKFPAR